METIKQLVGAIIFIAMAYVAFEITFLFGLFFFTGGIYALVVHNAWERPGIPILWLMGGLASRVVFTDMLLPILKSETLIDFVILLLASGIIYLTGHKIKNF